MKNLLLAIFLSSPGVLIGEPALLIDIHHLGCFDRIGYPIEENVVRYYYPGQILVPTTFIDTEDEEEYPRKWAFMEGEDCWIPVDKESLVHSLKVLRSPGALCVNSDSPPPYYDGPYTIILLLSHRFIRLDYFGKSGRQLYLSRKDSRTAHLSITIGEILSAEESLEFHSEMRHYYGTHDAPIVSIEVAEISKLKTAKTNHGTFAAVPNAEFPTEQEFVKHCRSSPESTWYYMGNEALRTTSIPNASNIANWP